MIGQEDAGLGVWEGEEAEADVERLANYLVEVLEQRIVHGIECWRD